MKIEYKLTFELKNPEVKVGDNLETQLAVAICNVIDQGKTASGYTEDMLRFDLDLIKKQIGKFNLAGQEVA